MPINYGSTGPGSTTLDIAIKIEKSEGRQNEQKREVKILCCEKASCFEIL
jgi:hypothetical protein